MIQKNGTAEGLIEKIRIDTETEASAIVQKAQKIRQDRLNAQEHWEKREEKSWKKKEKDFRKEMEDRQEATYRMEKKRLSLQAQERLMNRIEEEAMHRIEDSMNQPVYREYLKDWVAEGVLALGEAEILLKGSPRDLKLMDPSFLEEVQKEFFQNTGLKVSLSVSSDPPELVPGVLLESADGRVSFNNQLPARFRRMKTRIRQVISAGLQEGTAADE